MNKRDRVRIEQTGRVATFAQNNKADFNSLAASAKTKALALTNTLNTADTGIVARLEEFSKGRESGSIDFHEGTTSKATIRDGIILELGDWNEAAATIASDAGTPEIMQGFRVPHGASAESFAAKVRAICDHAEDFSTQFVALGFAADFADSMRERVDAFEKATDDKGTGLSTQTGARGGMSETIREGVLAGRQLNVIFKNLYKDNAEMRTAWATAFHTERVGVSGKKKQQPQPTLAPAMTPSPALATA